ncbi:nucleotide exchange factor GrpE [Aliivibrio fischeri]|uniref:Protein GrpE n=3 Tax=Aliivibrio fischeri TaxID=668 RepID=GRPE_ALIFM|nr:MULTISPECIES: nucleotide exchange factor GrpE [Aliivibrio]B5FA13.1 RecName: Full=Protein GrpE; AltName: Full=HSP-70 cofactor [Aliivibrio fischeri MJ11]ACH65670.1 co-chaperone GrpE [Aliivibrio fischeri MJ11]EHN70444.1 co-chaperone GrpE [Aliivibrio fischeri SR5]MBD1569001.1 nucleotide exchange factor GrpE [Aliivibrio sp. S10_S31]MBP3142659.1 nucleotide exchange factor GrpE [Aliivibrio fischeri]MBP3156718.1 nucleotide exchange factor GrpE [Aliivibrio fischeri]
MSNEENKVNEEAVVEEQVEAVGTEADVEWNESAEDSQEAKIAELEAALLASQAQIKEQQDTVLRAKAEEQNVRRRAEEDVDKARKYALKKFAGELLPVLDNLERALENGDKENEAAKALLEGVELTLQTFVSTVEKFGLTVINPMGEAFNPELHQAIGMQASPDHESNTVMIVMQKGYTLNDQVLRPAMVMVAQ